MISHSKPTIGNEEIKAVINSLKKLRLKGNLEVSNLENKLKNYYKYKEAVAVTTGSLAVTTILKAFNSKKLRVALPTYMCRTVYDAIYLAGAKPLLVDINPDYLSIDIKSAKKLRADVVIVPHIFGIRAPIEEFLKENWITIEDCAQRLTPVKTAIKEPKAHFKIISLEATKLLTSGEGGIILSDETGILEKIKMQRDASYNFNSPASVFPLTDIQAVIAIEQLKKLPAFLLRRKEIANFYIQNIAKEIIHPSMFKKDTYHFRFLLNLKHPEKFIKYMLNKGITCRRPIAPFALHTLFNIKGNFKNTQETFDKAVSIPLYPSLRDTEIKMICREISNFKNI
jgi:dTDP-4-amino-4,6-dideoxygalactose transaminase